MSAFALMRLLIGESLVPPERSEMPMVGSDPASRRSRLHIMVVEFKKHCAPNADLSQRLVRP